MADIEKLDAKRVRLTNKIAKSIAKHEPASGAINEAFEELFDVSEMQLFESVPPTTEEAIAKTLHARLAIMFLLSNSNMDASEQTVEILKEYKKMWKRKICIQFYKKLTTTKDRPWDLIAFTP